MHHRRCRPRPFASRRLPAHWRGRDCQGEYPGRNPDLADDHPDAAEDRFPLSHAGRHLLAGYRRHAVHQLGRQAVLDGVAGLALHRLAARPLSSR
ncbi:hypothetical protein D3C87_1712350 [compost metagenome]